MGRNRKMSMEEAEAVLHSKLSSSGKKEELCEKLMRDLNEGGFRDQVKLLAMDVVQEKGADRCNVEDVVQEVAPRAVGLVPDNCRKSIAKEIKRYLKDECDDLN